MIQANELRIGNVLMYMSDEGPMRCKIDAQDILFCQDVNVAFNEVHKPIPLTPELLLEMGSEERKPPYSREFYLLNRLIMFDENGAFDYAERTRLPYLHTLQNFIYAVKGVELTINTK
jgi:hypothetical protein